MKTNNGDFIRGDGNRLSSTAETRETYGMGADSQLTISEEGLCEYLVTKHENQFPLSDDRKQEFQQDQRLFAETIRKNVVRRKAD